jgi:Uma2 family endonuclease
MGTQTLLTAEQFAQLPQSETEDFELVDGELIPLPSANADHSLIKDFIVISFWMYLQKNPIGMLLSEINCRLTGKVVRRPDVAFFLDQPGRTIPRKQVPLPFAPDIAIEVLSPSEPAVDVNKKVLEYQEAGSQEVWVLDQENAEVFIYTRGGVRVLRPEAKLTSPLLPGFELSIAEIFAR